MVGLPSDFDEINKENPVYSIADIYKSDAECDLCFAKDIGLGDVTPTQSYQVPNGKILQWREPTPKDPLKELLKLDFICDKCFNYYFVLTDKGVSTALNGLGVAYDG